MIKYDLRKMDNNEYISVCEPFLNGKELQYIVEAVETGWISSAGKYINEFETAFAEYLGVKHAIAVTNGTAALHLALVALGIGKGDEVIIPDFTMIASAFAVTYTGATPVFIDAERETWNIDTSLIEEKITKKTKAIMPVHIWGHPCELDAITKIAKKYDLKIIEDAAEAHGSEYKGTKCGNLGNIATFSFFANKIATTGEGGMVVTNDDELANRCRYYKNLCFPLSSSRNYKHNNIGFNYRMSNIHAAIGLAQIEKLDFYVRKRRKINALYQELLKDVPGIKLQPEKSWAKNAYWMNGIVINENEYGMTRDNLMVDLHKKGVGTRLFFSGMHQQKSLIDFGCNIQSDFPVSLWLEKNGMYLPSASNLSIKNIEYITDIIKDNYLK
jgi:perosamine synthetase